MGNDQRILHSLDIVINVTLLTFLLHCDIVISIYYIPTLFYYFLIFFSILTARAPGLCIMILGIIPGNEKL